MVPSTDYDRPVVPLNRIVTMFNNMTAEAREIRANRESKKDVQETEQLSPMHPATRRAAVSASQEAPLAVARDAASEAVGSDGRGTVIDVNA